MDIKSGKFYFKEIFLTLPLTSLSFIVKIQVVPGCNCCDIDGELVSNGFDITIDGEEYGKNNFLLGSLTLFLARVL